MRILKGFGYWVVAVLAVLIAVASFRFLTFNPQVLDEFLRPNLIDHPIPFYLHVILAPVALLIGVWQFLPITRRNAWHRWEGRLYVVCVLVAAISGFIVAFTTAAGPVHATGFAILAVLWFGTTLMAYLKVRAGKYTEHRRWMIRSYALTCAAITLRIILPVGLISGLDFPTSYLLAAWGCWTINLVIAELVIRYSKPPADLPADRPSVPTRTAAASAA
jgi:uncharacterized membrane protein